MAKMPRVQNPKWLTEEYATSFLILLHQTRQGSADDADDRGTARICTMVTAMTLWNQRRRSG
jgi:hypothetical protein